MNFLNFIQDYYRLRQFYYIAKAGSLTGGAKIMGVSHPSLSRSMGELEHRLKTKLFKREARGMKLTSDGERLLEHILKNFQENEAFLKAFLDKGDELEGEIHIKTTPFFADVELTPYLLEFLEKHPKINLRVSTTTDDFDIDGVDVAIRAFIENRPDLEQLPLHKHHHKFWASEAYLKKFGIPKILQDLENHKLLAFGKHNNFYYTNSLNWLLYSETTEPRTPHFQLTSHGGLIKAATMGHGIVQLPQEWVESAELPLIEVLPRLVDAPVVQIYFIFNKKFAKLNRLNTLYKSLYRCFNKEK
jgi:DNA-binding transcriptional LysR family regulator